MDKLTALAVLEHERAHRYPMQIGGFPTTAGSDGNDVSPPLDPVVVKHLAVAEHRADRGWVYPHGGLWIARLPKADGFAWPPEFVLLTVHANIVYALAPRQSGRDLRWESLPANNGFALSFACTWRPCMPDGTPAVPLDAVTIAARRQQLLASLGTLGKSPTPWELPPGMRWAGPTSTVLVPVDPSTDEAMLARGAERADEEGKGS